jgi:hypothetical protein
MMDGLTKFEETLKKPRTKWSKTDWHRRIQFAPN